jgi:hypothetical protein
MLAVLYPLGMLFIDLFKSRRRLEAENLFLRHQLSVALRRAPSPTQCRPEASAVSPSIEWLRPGAAGLDDPAVAEPARRDEGG